MPVSRLGTIAWLAGLVLLAACAPRVTVEFVPNGGAYTAADLDAMLASTDLGSVARLRSEEAATARQEALASLRRHGNEAAALADSLTTDFPLDAAAVPVIVERGSYEGAPAWIVIEAWGDAGGRLEHKRVWVFSLDDRDVIAARSAL